MSINFFTPISYGNQPKTPRQSIEELIDNCFYFGGKKACVIDIARPTEVALLKKSSSFLSTCLKVILLCSIILPIILLIAKYVIRNELTQPLDGRLPLDPALCNFYEEKGILRDIQKPIAIEDLNTLGLDLDETESINPDPTETEFPILVQFTLRQATTEVIDKINETIQAKDRQPISHTRNVYLDDSAATLDKGSNIHFYSKVFGRLPNDRCEDNLWLPRITKALKEQGHIFTAHRHLAGYHIQA